MLLETDPVDVLLEYEYWLVDVLVVTTNPLIGLKDSAFLMLVKVMMKEVPAITCDDMPITLKVEPVNPQATAPLKAR